MGIVRLSGPGCPALASSFLRVGPRGLKPRSATLARAVFEGRLLDTVLATFFPGPASYTGEDVLEIAAHGSPFVLGALLDCAVRAGARLAEPGEFTRRAFLNGRLDLAQAEAVCRLVRARTRLAHRAAMAQLDGGLSRKIAAVRRRVLEILAAVQAGLDHPEDGVPELEAGESARRIRAVLEELARLARSYRTGRLHLEGARVAIVGRPNAGKSSLLNALLGRERAIVSPAPGTTRDTLEEPVELEGLNAVLVDTAGLREGSCDPIEAAGMIRAREALASADLALVVFDRSLPLSREDLAVWSEAARRDRPALAVLNKADLPRKLELGGIPRGQDAVEVSARTGEGIESLSSAVARELGAEGGAREEALLTSLRHKRAVEEAAAALELAAGTCGEGELASLHLREALHALGAILGETTGEDVLREVFSRFCVGK